MGKTVTITALSGDEEFTAYVARGSPRRDRRDPGNFWRERGDSP